MKGLTLALGFVLSSPVWAHHSFAAEFDEKKPVTLQGTVIQMEWVNPHTWIHIAVKNPDGTVTEWRVEGNTPNSLLRAGFTRKSLEAGMEIVVRGYLARSGDKIASGSTVTFRDGKKLSLGSSHDEPPASALLGWVSQDEAIWRKQAAEQAQGQHDR